MLHFDIDVKTGIRLREVMLNDAPMIYRAIADHRDYLKTWLPFIANLSEQDEMDFLSQVLSFPEEERNFTFVIECRGEFCGLVGCSDTLSMGCGSTFDASHSNSVCRKKLFE